MLDGFAAFLLRIEDFSHPQVGVCLFVGRGVFTRDDVRKLLDGFFELLPLDVAVGQPVVNPGDSEPFVTIFLRLHFRQDLLVHLNGVVPVLHLAVDRSLRELKEEIAGILRMKLVDQPQRIVVLLLTVIDHQQHHLGIR